MPDRNQNIEFAIALRGCSWRQRAKLMTVKSVQRVLEIYELLDETRRAVTLKDVTDRLSYPASSASYLLKSMVSLGYLTYDRRSKAYMPTMRMSAKVNWVEHGLFGGGGILDAMQLLHDACGETVSLGVQSGEYAQYVHQIATRLPLPYPRGRQTIRPINQSGLGWLLLSALDDEEVDSIIRRLDYRERTHRNRNKSGQLFLELNKIRQEGFVFSRHTIVHGAGYLGMLMPSSEDNMHPRLAIGVNGPVDRLEEKRSAILSLLKEAMDRTFVTRNLMVPMPEVGPQWVP